VLTEKARDEQKELTQRLKDDAWQHRSVRLLYDSIKALGVPKDALPQKVAAKAWFTLFTEIRNSQKIGTATYLKRSLSLF